MDTTHSSAIENKLAVVFLFLSGIASLIYQVSWVRLLQLSIGSTSVAVSLVIAAFFIGLAFGSFLTAHVQKYNIDSLQPYIVLEAIIGVAALILLPLLLNLDYILSMWPVLGHSNILKLILIVTVLAIPCICIGATYPLMTVLLIRRQQEIGTNLGLLYGINTAGAVVGALLSGFLLIPVWGLDGAIYIGICINFSIVAVGLMMNKHIHLPAAQYPKTEIGTAQTNTYNQNYALVLLAITGFSGLACEVAWTKYLAIFTHTTLYGFSAILAIFLVGIASGAWAVKSRLDSLKYPSIWMTYGMLILGASLIVTRVALNEIPMFHFSYYFNTEYSVTQSLVKYGLVVIVLIVPTFILGALFSLNIYIYSGPINVIRQRVGVAYAINTIGGIAGALFAGLYIIPNFGTNILLQIVVVVVILSPVIYLIHKPNTRKRQQMASIALVLLVLNFAAPDLDYKNVIAASPYYFDPASQSTTAPEFLYVKEGKTSVTSVASYNGKQLRLLTNNLPEAVITPPDPYPWLTETLLGFLPYLLHPNPKELFVIGLGAGTTLAALTNTDATSINVVELEPNVREANDIIFTGGLDALQDPRINLGFDDARHRLLLDTAKYDAIISQPSHPWLAGNANLFTMEFYQMAQTRLNENGLYVQWINLFNMDTTTLLSILKAFYTVFPYGFTFDLQREGSVLVVGSNTPIYFDTSRIRQRLTQPRVQNVLRRWGLRNEIELLRLFGLSRAQSLQAAIDITPNTDTNILSEIRLSRLNARPTGKESVLVFFNEHSTFDISSFFQSSEKTGAMNKMYRYFLSINDRNRANLIKKQANPTF